jgi:hypothetical protein
METLFDHLDRAYKRRDFDLAGAKRTAAGRKDALLKYLETYHQGKETAIRASDLAKLFGDKTDRPTRMAIQDLRNDGSLILSNAHGGKKGYFIASTIQEYKEFREQNFRNRALSILHTDSMMAKSARQVFGDAVQLELDLT